MPPDAIVHHVFVDFENVPSVELTLIDGKPVHVTLLIGEKQKRLDLALVRAIHRHATQVTLIEVGASGRNALDLVLACHLGQAATHHPQANFHIISKDKDFDPLVAHLKNAGVRVARHGAFDALPFFGRPRKIVPRPAEEERLAKLIDRLETKTRARPAKRTRLLSHINGFYGNALSEAELEGIAANLVDRGIIAIDPEGRVTYP
jgi:hypothetical protein